MKSDMDNIFASIASGVITTDVMGRIATLNQAAEHILGVDTAETAGLPYGQALPDLGPWIAPFVSAAMEQDEQMTGYELEIELPNRGRVVLNLNVSPLKDSRQVTTGVAVVVDDLTERRMLENQARQVRRTFERYVAPSVVERLLSDPTSVQLGGILREATIFYADIRNFTPFSRTVAPELQIDILNRHLSLSAEAVLAEEGTLDKFIGDAVMALFNVPLPQPDHLLRAVRAALATQRAIAEMHTHVPPGERLSFGIGISTGPVVVGNIGSTTTHNYTAIGDVVNMAARLQEHAKAGQILLTAAAYEQARQHIVGRELGYVNVKGIAEPVQAFEVLGLKG
jgi:PAS domain S-box-containing protein